MLLVISPKLTPNIVVSKKKKKKKNYYKSGTL